MKKHGFHLQIPLIRKTNVDGFLSELLYLGSHVDITRIRETL
jgi:hypothetical protein